MTTVSTGIPKLDEVLMDGIPTGFTILVEGAPASGMELFAKQFASGKANEDVIYFSTAESLSEVTDTMKKYNWDTDIRIISIATEYYEKVLAKELTAAKAKREGLSMSDIAKLGAPEEKKGEEVNLLEDLVYEVSKLSGKYRVIIDSLDFFLLHYPTEDVLSAIRTIVAHIRYTKGVALFTLTKDVCEKRTETGMWASIDCIIELEIERVGTSFENRLVLRKVKNMPQKMLILIFSVTDVGITPEMVTRIG